MALFEDRLILRLNEIDETQWIKWKKRLFGEHCVTENVPDCFEELPTFKSEGMWADLQPIGISFFFGVRSAIKAEICF